MNKKSFIIIALAFAIGCFLGYSYEKNTYNKSPNISSTVNTNKAIKKYTLIKFMNIQMGMSYDQVKQILGDGVKDTNALDASPIQQYYIWENNDGSSIRVTFVSNRAIYKEQDNLDNSFKFNITKKQFDKIQRGMTYSQVKEILLVDGQLIKQYGSWQTNNTGSELYEWYNINKSYISILFKNGKVSSRYEENLK
jgi:hypothetical protein